MPASRATREELHALLARRTGTAATARIARLDELAGRGDLGRSPGAENGGENGGENGWENGGENGWEIDALRGRLVELSARGATATLTIAIDLVLEAQLAAEPVAWVTFGNTTFYPPDAAASGVDLAALVVVRVLDATAAAQAAERLLRSGAFGLVVLDFGGLATAELPIAHQGRLVTLAQTHDAAVVCITEKPGEAPSLGSLVSLRAEAARQHDRHHGYQVALRVLKDKRRGPGWSRTTQRRGPAGLDRDVRLDVQRSPAGDQD